MNTTHRETSPAIGGIIIKIFIHFFCMPRRFFIEMALIALARIIKTRKNIPRGVVTSVFRVSILFILDFEFWFLNLNIQRVELQKVQLLPKL